jgi:hypothetical protein
MTSCVLPHLLEVDDVILLSAYDQSLGAGPPLSRLFCYNYIPDVQRMADSFYETLLCFPRLATRIEQTAGGDFILRRSLAHPSFSLRRKQRWCPNDFVAEDLPIFVDLPMSRPQQSVLTATLTLVPDGAVLGVGMSHAAGDARSFWRFLKEWNERFDCGVFSDKSQPRDETVDVLDTLVKSPADHRHFSRISFNGDFLNAIRDEMTSADLRPSLNETLTALILHRCAGRMLGHAKPRLRMAVDLRGIHPAIPSDFFGNGFLEIALSLDEFQDTPTSACTTVSRIRKAVETVRSVEHIASHLDCRGSLDARDVAPFKRQTDILSTNFTRLPLDDIAFGGGAPVKVFCVLSASAGFVIMKSTNGFEAQIVNDRHSISSAAFV